MAAPAPYSEIPAPDELTAETIAATTRFVHACAGQDSALILNMLGID